MQIFLGILIGLCVAGEILMVINTVRFWKSSAELPFEKRAVGLQIRMTVIPVFLVVIVILVLIMKKM